MIKGVLFDFNGTLFFDSDLHILAFQRFFEKNGLEVLDADAIAALILGRTNTDIFTDIAGKDVGAQRIDAMGLEKEAYYREMCLERPEIFKLADGVCEMFDWLVQNGIPFNIATGSGIENVEFYYDKFELGRWLPFEKIVYNDKTLRGKPEPDFYIEAARRIGLEVGECIVFEDAISGFKSARRAGAGALLAVVPDGLGFSVSEEVAVDGEIKDFKDYISVFQKYGLCKGKDQN